MIFQANFQIAAGKEILTRPLIAGFAEFLTLAMTQAKAAIKTASLFPKNSILRLREPPNRASAKNHSLSE